MPTSGTKYFGFDAHGREWVAQYSADLAPETRTRIVEVLIAGAKTLGYWEPKPWGPIIEDRGTQVTRSLRSARMRKLMAAVGLTNDELLYFGDQLGECGNDYPVKSVGIDTISVRGWEETALAIQAIIEVS